MAKFKEFFKKHFVNADRKPKPKKDILKSIARIYNFIIYILLLAVDFIYLKLNNFIFKLNLISILLLILTIIQTFKVIKNIYCIIKTNEHIAEVEESDVRSSVASGAPGAGKTSSKLFDSVVKAKRMWEELQYKYWLMLSTDDNTLSPEELKDKQEIIEAYTFYNEQDTVPCLWSNIPVKVDGKKANKLTKAHLLQKKKLPIYSVLFSDEIGNDFEAQPKTSAKLKPLEALSRFIRHFFDGFWSFTEQEFSKAFIGVRRTTGSNRFFMSQKWALKPSFLLWIYDLLKDHFISDLQSANKYKYQSKTYQEFIECATYTSQKYSKFMNKFKHFINCIGYRHYTYKELGNIENGVVSSDKQKKGKFYVPSCLNCSYDDRCYRLLYKAKDKVLEPSKFKKNILTDEDLKAS